LLRAVGFIDKARDIGGFVRLVRSFHFGCLFSSVEAFGLSNVECQRLGVPVLTWDRGGIADTVQQGTAHLFADGATPDEITDVVEGYLRVPERYRRLRREVEQRADTFSWGVAVERFQELWGQPDQGALLQRAG
jgi:glycosyltransferase involved in cell wall biosynthesis